VLRKLAEADEPEIRRLEIKISAETGGRKPEAVEYRHETDLTD